MMAGDEVICPWHDSRFNVKTGVVLTLSARQGMKSFPVRVARNYVEVDIEKGAVVPPMEF
jgi:nitrite reductase/ring-hydroxylating ferredoxin subunit